jgi:hypothetical protein
LPTAADAERPCASLVRVICVQLAAESGRGLRPRNTDRDLCSHHASGLKSAPEARGPWHQPVSLGVWDEAAVVTPGQAGGQVPHMEASHHDRDGAGVRRVPRLGHEKQTSDSSVQPAAVIPASVGPSPLSTAASRYRRSRPQSPPLGSARSQHEEARRWVSIRSSTRRRSASNGRTVPRRGIVDGHVIEQGCWSRN